MAYSSLLYQTVTALLFGGGCGVTLSRRRYATARARSAAAAARGPGSS